jgi:chromosome segregation ATPase
MSTLWNAEGRQRGMILHTMGGMQDQIQTLEKSLREETRRVEDANAKLAQREQEIENLKQVLMDEVLEVSHASSEQSR